MRLNFISGIILFFLTSAAVFAVSAEPVGFIPKTAVVAREPTAPRQADRPVAMDTGRVHLNVKGGYYSQLESKSEKEQSYVLVLEGVNKHAKWSPLQSLCVQGAKPGKMACLKVIHRMQDDTGLYMEMMVGSNADANRTYTRLDGEFVIREEIVVKILIGAANIEFFVNGKHVFDQPIDFETDKIALGCSSAECIFTLL